MPVRCSGCFDAHFGVAFPPAMAILSSAQNSELVTKLLLVVSAVSLLYGLWRLAGASELEALYWLVAGGLCLKACSDRERARASR